MVGHTVEREMAANNQLLLLCYVDRDWTYDKLDT
jgi:hypothetical protein